MDGSAVPTHRGFLHKGSPHQEKDPTKENDRTNTGRAAQHAVRGDVFASTLRTGNQGMVAITLGDALTLAHLWEWVGNRLTMFRPRHRWTTNSIRARRSTIQLWRTLTSEAPQRKTLLSFLLPPFPIAAKRNPPPGLGKLPQGHQATPLSGSSQSPFMS